jgi:hypothetical protein
MVAFFMEGERKVRSGAKQIVPVVSEEERITAGEWKATGVPPHGRGGLLARRRCEVSGLGRRVGGSKGFQVVNRVADGVDQVALLRLPRLVD